MPYGVPIPVCVVAGAVIAVIGGLLLAVPALRLRGPYFGLVTLVAVLLLQNAIVIFAGVTGGEIGMTVPDVLSIDQRHELLVSRSPSSSSAPSSCSACRARRSG